MALYFLPKSPTYVKKTEKSIFRRREAVCQHLNDVYKVPKNKDEEVYAKVVQELAAEGISINESQYGSAKAVLRSTFLWLNEKNEIGKAEQAAQKSSASGVIKYLMADGITTWEGISQEKPPAQPAEETAPACVLPPASKLAQHPAGREVINSFNQQVAYLEVMLNENDELKAENLRLLNLHDDYETYLQFVENENASLLDQLGKVKQCMRHMHSASLEEIAAEYPEFPQLQEIAKLLKEGPARRQALVGKLACELPRSFAWQNDKGTIIYERWFLEALADLKRDEQEQVVKQVSTLATQGMEYHSLHTRKCEMRLPFSPAGCMTSRGAETLRFTWKKNGDLHIYWLYRKGDSRVRQSEA